MAKQSSQRIVRELFHLPDQEDVLDDFSCALQKKVSLNGRLFCTDNHLCFYANILGFKTKLVIAFKDVTSITKSAKEKRAIEVTCGPKTYIFRTFYGSNEALSFIHALWRNTGVVSSDEVCRWSDDEESPVQEPEIEDALLIPPDESSSAFETTKVIVPLSPQQFFDKFYSDTAEFPFADFFTVRGDTEIQFGTWVANEEMGGFTRDVKFRTPIKGAPIGPKSTRCELLQQYTLQANKLTVKQSCKALDVPFSSNFLVEQEWTILSIAPEKSVLRISANINFIKSTFLRSMIESRTRPGIIEDHENWLAEMRKKKAFPEDQLLVAAEQKPEEKHHSVTRYDEVDPKVLIRSKERSAASQALELAALATSLGVVFLALYLMFLHGRLDALIT